MSEQRGQRKPPKSRPPVVGAGIWRAIGEARRGERQWWLSPEWAADPPPRPEWQQNLIDDILAAWDRGEEVHINFTQPRYR